MGVLNTKFYENPSDQNRAVLYGQMYGLTDMTGLTVAFRTCFVKPPKNAYNNSPRIIRSHNTWYRNIPHCTALAIFLPCFSAIDQILRKHGATGEVTFLWYKVNIVTQRAQRTKILN
jgi:hypothetical protein